MEWNAIYPQVLRITIEKSPCRSVSRIRTGGISLFAPAKSSVSLICTLNQQGWRDGLIDPRQRCRDHNGLAWLCWMNSQLNFRPGQDGRRLLAPPSRWNADSSTKLGLPYAIRIAHIRHIDVRVMPFAFELHRFYRGVGQLPVRSFIPFAACSEIPKRQTKQA